MSQIYAFNDYKDYLKSLLNQEEKSWGLVSKLADACGCQRSYFSRVVNGEVHLTPDHAYNLSRYLNLSETEVEYFLCLLEKDRASTKTYRDRQIAKIKRIREEQEDLQSVVQRPAASFGEKEFFYYSNWIVSAIHILVSIPEFQTVQSISQKLQVDNFTVEHTLQILKSFDLVKYEKGKWQYSSGEMHVPKNSPLVNLHHNNWKQRAMLDSQKLRTDGVHFTVVQSIDAKAWEQIKFKLLEFIGDFAKIAGPADCEDLVCLTLDFFKP